MFNQLFLIRSEELQLVNPAEGGSRQKYECQSVGMADKHASEACARKGVGVQLSPLAQKETGWVGGQRKSAKIFKEQKVTYSL